MANLSDTSRATLVYVREDSWGETPAPSAAVTEVAKQAKQLRFTSESLKVNRATTVSEEIRPDRQITDLIATNFNAEGDISGEFSADTYDDFLISALFGRDLDGTAADLSGTAVTTGLAVTDDITTLVKTKKTGVGNEKFGTFDITFSTAAKATAALPILKAGTLFCIGHSASDTTVKPEFYRVVAAPKKKPTAATNLLVEAQLLSDSASADFGSGNIASTKIGTIQKFKSLVNSTVQRSFTIEKRFALDDGTINYLSFPGMVVSSFDLSLEAESKITLNMSFMGRDGNTSGSTVINDHLKGNAPIQTSTEILNAVDHVGTVDDGTGGVSIIKSINIGFNNNLRGRTAVGNRGNISIGTGRFSITGSANHYFQTRNLYEKFLKNEHFSMYFIVNTHIFNPDSTTGQKGYVFFMPRVKFTDSMVTAGGIDQDIMVDSSYQALRDPVTGSTLIITRIK